mgnify:CR=1 FL=1
MDNYKICVIGALCLVILGLCYLIRNRNVESFEDSVKSEVKAVEESAPVKKSNRGVQKSPGPVPAAEGSQEQPKRLLDDESDPVLGNASPASAFPKGSLKPQDLLPSQEATAWSHANPVGAGELEDQNFLTAGFHVGINTVGQSLRNANLQIRSEPPNPQKKVGPWMQSTIEPDLNRKALEVDGEM